MCSVGKERKPDFPLKNPLWNPEVKVVMQECQQGNLHVMQVTENILSCAKCSLWWGSWGDCMCWCYRLMLIWAKPFSLFPKIQPPGVWHWTVPFSDHQEIFIHPNLLCLINPTSILSAHCNASDYMLSRLFEHSEETEILQKITLGSIQLISPAGCSCCQGHLIASSTVTICSSCHHQGL